jgi:hypothetical protein
MITFDTAYFVVDVLATDPDQADQITESINQASRKLIQDTVAKLKQPEDSVSYLNELLRFTPADCSDSGITNALGKMRRFRLAIPILRFDIVEAHLVDLSKQFLQTPFLVEYRDWYSSCKRVMRDGEIVQEAIDGVHRVHGMDWASIDIFAPFKAEYESGFPFGVLWDEWVDDLIEAAGLLKEIKSGTV